VGCALPEGLAKDALASSLATFQLGETGEGRKLQSFAKRVAKRLPDYDRAVAMFVAEEGRHAAYLAGGVEYLGGDLKQKQWTDACFRKLRRMINFEFELQVLLTAEIIGMSYYALMADAVPDPSVRDLCRRLVADEVGHLRFHAEFFEHRFRHAKRAWVALWRWQFRTIFHAARAVAWWDHRRALAAYGVGLGVFVRRSHRDRRWFEGELFGWSLRPDAVATAERRG
jgi:hypothetical protein